MLTFYVWFLHNSEIEWSTVTYSICLFLSVRNTVLWRWNYSIYFCWFNSESILNYYLCVNVNLKMTSFLLRLHVYNTWTYVTQCGQNRPSHSWDGQLDWTAVSLCFTWSAPIFLADHCFCWVRQIHAVSPFFLLKRLTFACMHY